MRKNTWILIVDLLIIEYCCKRIIFAPKIFNNQYVNTEYSSVFPINSLIHFASQQSLPFRRLCVFIWQNVIRVRDSFTQRPLRVDTAVTFMNPRKEKKPVIYRISIEEMSGRFEKQWTMNNEQCLWREIVPFFRCDIEYWFFVLIVIGIRCGRIIFAYENIPACVGQAIINISIQNIQVFSPSIP